MFILLLPYIPFLNYEPNSGQCQLSLISASKMWKCRQKNLNLILRISTLNGTETPTLLHHWLCHGSLVSQADVWAWPTKCKTCCCSNLRQTHYWYRTNTRNKHEASSIAICIVLSVGLYTSFLYLCFGKKKKQGSAPFSLYCVEGFWVGWREKESIGVCVMFVYRLSPFCIW